MSSTFHGLNTASSGLQAQQAALNVTGHNIANANSANYTRQQAVISSRSVPQDGNTTTLGNGAEVSSVRRMQDLFVEDRLRSAGGDVAYDQTSQAGLDGVVAIFGEPSENGLSSDLDRFWNSWQALSVNPENLPARQTVLQQGEAVADHLNQFSTQLSDLQGQQKGILSDGVDKLNGLASELADLNGSIQSASGEISSDLLDRRNSILNDIYQLADVKVTGNGGMGDIVSIGGHMLVQGSHASPLAVATDESGNLSVQWSGDEEPSQATMTGGQLGATLKLSNETLPGYLTAVDNIAKGLIDKVNTVHRSGTGLDGETGRDFFTGTGAKDIQVNSELADQPRKLGVSASGAPGDGSLALSLSKVKSEVGADGSTINDSYRSLVTQSGAEAARLGRQVTQKTQVQQQLMMQQQSVSGVNLDEEMTDMIRFQQAYAANARVVSAMDEMIGTLIDRLGA